MGFTGAGSLVMMVDVWVANVFTGQGWLVTIAIGRDRATELAALRCRPSAPWR
jgi:hypothetical protein